MSNPDFTKISLSEPQAESFDEWKSKFEKEVSANYDSLTERTMEHIPVKPLYTHDEYDHMNHLDFVSGLPDVRVQTMDSSSICRILDS